ncbi:MAG TPA: hypothetical protein VMY34_04130, partial [Acidimicrobiales bacterium]|nr:hypothetical protein [Acidimicrobiales bacterium]
MSERVRRPVPVRTIAAAIAMVLGTLATIYAIEKLAKIITWVIIAAFFALILNPAVDFLERRLKLRRGIAAFIVFLFGVGLVAGMLYLFIRPLV